MNSSKPKLNHDKSRLASAGPRTSQRSRRAEVANSRCEIVIPARLASTRLPEKLLLRETGKTILQHTYESARRAERPAGITVAVDCQRLKDEVESFGGAAVLTDPELPSGTDRVAAVAKQRDDVAIFVNVQGDEPEIAAEAIDRVVELLERSPKASVATLATPIRNRQQLEDPACVKVVHNSDGRALYFSRSPIPYVREWEDRILQQDPPVFLQHIGIYAYRREFLVSMDRLPPSPLEQLEKLEQLRFLQAGHDIRLGVVEHSAAGIDTAADYEAFLRRYQSRRAA
jgi:3-deoxy-manno-octulosonate cytidylyltransferase (CMP-KDO synthetase)